MSLKETARVVLKIVEDGRYFVAGREVDIADRQTSAVENTRLYTPEEVADLPASPSAADSTVRVTDATTQRAARELATTGDVRHVALLNFASAWNPGGGFLNGAKAQEEDLCRCSGLYPCLLRHPGYYKANREQKSLLYTDHIIFSPGVPFFKTTGTGDLLATPYSASVITAPAPNTGPYLKTNPGATDDLARTFERRWRNVLRVARDQAVTHLLLGAWGCGAFGGDPAVASETAKQAIQTDGGGFREIVFAIPGTGRRSKTNLVSFQTTFGDES